MESLEKPKLKANVFFGKKESAELAGVAIILMFLFHTVAFPERVIPEIEYKSLIKLGSFDITLMIAATGRVCVGIFAFITGYAIWIKKEEYKTTKRFNRLIKFLFSFWFVTLLFMIYAVTIPGEKLPGMKQFVMHLFGLGLGPGDYICVAHGWYVFYYISLIVVSPVLLLLFSKKGLVFDIILFVAIIILLFFVPNLKEGLPGEIAQDLRPMSISIIGMLFAKYNVYEKSKPYIMSLNAGVIIILFAGLFIINYKSIICAENLGGGKFDLYFLTETLFAPLFIFLSVALIKKIHFGIIDRILMFLGGLSMDIWFIHSIFQSGTRQLQPVLYWPKYSELILLWGILIMIPVAYLVRFLRVKTFNMFKTQYRLMT